MRSIIRRRKGFYPDVLNALTQILRPDMVTVNLPAHYLCLNLSARTAQPQLRRRALTAPQQVSDLIQRLTFHRGPVYRQQHVLRLYPRLTRRTAKIYICYHRLTVPLLHRNANAYIITR